MTRRACAGHWRRSSISAQGRSRGLKWGELSWLWARVFPAGKDNLFSGLTVVVLVVCALTALLSRRDAGRQSRRGWPRSLLGVVAGLSLALIVVVLWHGPVNTTIGPFPLKVRRLDRALLLLLLLTGGPFLWMTAHFRRALAGRSPMLFYMAGAVVFAVLAGGPVLRVNGHTVLDPAPHGWLMWLPGFEELRVPTQIKMVFLLCLSVAGGLSLAALRPSRPGVARAVLGVAVAGVLLDGWLMRMPMVEAQPLWPVAEPDDRTEPILELPLGPAYDAGATLRASIHRRRVLNGISGYDPPYYAALREGLAARDPALLDAVATLGPRDVVVDGAADAGGALARYVADAAGATRTGSDGVRTVYRVPKAGPPEPLGPRLPVVAMQAVRHPQDVHLMHDGDSESGWTDVSATPGTWVTADLGSAQQVGGVTVAVGRAFFDCPRRLAVDLSRDGVAWVPAWEGPAYAHTFLGFMRAPRNGALRFRFPSHAARFVRLRRLDAASPAWHVAEIHVHAP